MSEVKSSYSSLKELCDDRKFKFGEVYFIKDELIDFPHSDKIAGSRTIHKGRRVVIISNNEHNSDKHSPIISVSPLSTRTDLIRKFDIELEKDKDGVKSNSIVMMELIQPVCKVDIERRCGEIREEKKIAILDSMLEIFGQ